MLKALRNSLYSVRYEYPDRTTQQRAGVLAFISITLVIFAILWVIIISAISALVGTTSNLLPPLVYGVMFLSLTVHFLIQRGRLDAASWIFVLMLLLIPLMISSTGISSNAMVFTLLPLVSAAGLLPRRGVFMVYVTMLAFIGIGYYNQLNSTQPAIAPATRATTDLILMLLGITITTIFIWTFNARTWYQLQNAQRVRRQYEKIAELSAKVITPSMTEDEAVGQALHHALTALGASYVQAFVTDAEGRVKRRVRSAFGLSLAIQVDEDVTLGDTNIITLAARARQIYTANADSLENRRRHFLASTRAGAALPIVQEEELLGVLDVQIENAQSFTEEQLELYQALANIIGSAIAIQRTRHALITSLQQAQEYGRARSTVQTRMVDQTGYWDTMFQQEGISSVGFNFEAAQKSFIEAKDLPATLRQTLSNGNVQTVTQPDGVYVSVPILLGAQVLGAMSFKLPPGRELSTRQIELVETIAERLALALENRRLFEQSRAQALRERKANEVASTLLAATDVQAVLRIAADNFNTALGAINTEIHVQPMPHAFTEQTEETVS